MITDGLYRLVGLKSTDISSEFDQIINTSSDVLVICGYSFTRPTNYNSTLKKIITATAKAKHCIFPIDLFRSRDVNRLTAIELINNGVSVSIEPNNHSKWLMTEREIYFGSANFTNYSIEKRIEVVAFKIFSNQDPLRKDFIDFTVSSIKHMKKTSNQSRIRGVIARNQRIMSTNSSLIKKFNPSIDKIVSTLSSISKAQSAINELLVNSYWLLDNKYYNELCKHAAYYSRLLGKINSQGNKIIQEYNLERDYGDSKEKYNEFCEFFTYGFERYNLMITDFIKSQDEIPNFVLLNRELVSKNIERINEFSK